MRFLFTFTALSFAAQLAYASPNDPLVDYRNPLTQRWERIPLSAITLADGKLRIKIFAPNTRADEFRWTLQAPGVYEDFMIDHWLSMEYPVSEGGATVRGPYHLRVKPRRMLAQTHTFDWNGLDLVQMEMGGFVAGDLDDDNQIELWEVGHVQRFAAKPQPTTEWAASSPFGWFDREHCDLNRDGSVDAKDVAIAYANLGRRGQD